MLLLGPFPFKLPRMVVLSIPNLPDISVGAYLFSVDHSHYQTLDYSNLPEKFPINSWPLLLRHHLHGALETKDLLVDIKSINRGHPGG
jgi:hypothetical protein